MADKFELPMPPAIEFDAPLLSGLKFYSQEDVEFLLKAAEITINFMREQVLKRDARIDELEELVGKYELAAKFPGDDERHVGASVATQLVHAQKMREDAEAREATKDARIAELEEASPGFSTVRDICDEYSAVCNGCGHTLGDEESPHSWKDCIAKVREFECKPDAETAYIMELESRIAELEASNARLRRLAGFGMRQLWNTVPYSRRWSRLMRVMLMWNEKKDASVEARVERLIRHWADAIETGRGL